jgi:hypothetical protein
MGLIYFASFSQMLRFLACLLIFAEPGGGLVCAFAITVDGCLV